MKTEDIGLKVKLEVDAEMIADSVVERVVDEISNRIGRERLLRPVTPFEMVETEQDVIRHDEVSRLFDRIREVLPWRDHEEDLLMSSVGTELTQREVWRKAIDEVLLLMDERMTYLRDKHA